MRTALAGIVLAPWVAAAWGCEASDTIDVDAVAAIDFGGRVTQIETLGRYTAFDIVPLLQLANAPGEAATTSGFYLYRVTYETRRFDGVAVPVSGLLGIPDTNEIKGIVSWQHGTNTYRPESISKPTLGEGLGIASLFAGNQYLFLAPDYIGLGVSTDVHPYYHVPSTVGAVVDLLAIGEIVLSELAAVPDYDLYLAGFSQGGNASVAVHRALQTQTANPTTLEIVGTASVAGGFKFAELALPFAVENDLIHYLAYLFAAYSHIYKQPLADLVQPPYVQLIPQWYDGTHDGEFLADHLPARIEDFLTPEFLINIALGERLPTWLYDAMDENQVYDWRPDSPIRLYFGSGDRDAPPHASIATYEHMRALGGNVTLANVGDYGHVLSLYHSIADIQGWFNEMDGQGR